MRENKLWDAVSGLTSGVLTSLIYDVLSDTSYELTGGEGSYILSQRQGNILPAILLILVTFFVLWCFISVLLPAAVRFFLRFSYKKIRPTSGKELVKTLDSAKKTALELHAIFFMDNPDQTLMALKVRELCQTAAALHRSFKPSSQRLRNNLPKHFRKPEHATIINMKHSVSEYELAAVVTLLERMANQALAAANDGTLLANDCGAALEMLQDLRICLPSCFLHTP